MKGFLTGLIFAASVFIAAGDVEAAHDTLINPPSGAGGTFPQLPSEEYQKEAGGMVVDFSAFQFSHPDGYHRIKAVVTAKDKKTGTPYGGALRLKIFKRSLPGKVVEVISDEFDRPFENRYQVFADIRNEGDFIVKVWFNESQLDVEFPMTVGDPGSSYLMIAFMAAILGVAAFFVYKKKSIKKEAPVPAG